MRYSVTVAEGREFDEWQRFAATHAPQNGMLDAGWYRVLDDAFSVKPFFLICRDPEGRIAGIASLYLSRSPFTGRHLASLDEGWCARDEEAGAAMLQEAIALRNSLGARYLLLRGAGDIANRAERVVPYVHRVVDTAQSLEAILRELRRKSRVRYIRRAGDNGFTVEQDRDVAKIDTFYHLYAEHMRDLGTPVMSIAYMRALKQHFGATGLRLFFVCREGREIGGMLCLASLGCWLDMYAVIRTGLLPQYPNYLLYWKVIEAAARAGVSKFDLGRSQPDSHAHQFKSKWPGRDREVLHGYFAEDVRVIPQRLERIRKQDSLLQRGWKRMPVAVANFLGPKLRSQLPFG
jgi:Acetyltransferase (GNAT) domain